MSEIRAGDLVKVTSRGLPSVDGRLAVVLEYVDVELKSGRMCYAKVLLPPGASMLYLSPEILELINT